MCKTHLNAERQDIDPEETAGYFDGSVSSPDRLLNFVKHCELDAHYQMAIASRVQMLPLTKQLTNLAGNAWCVLFLSQRSGLTFLRGRSNSRPGIRDDWNCYSPVHRISHACHLFARPHDLVLFLIAQLNSRFLGIVFRNKTLNGGRAERNEYILLHEFHRLKYICPDKTWGKKTTPKIAKEELEDDGGGGGGKGKGKGGKPKRDKYKGGLVFEPKRGLWDRYVLVMDFNSLYPSIIQEYNIDFSTVSSIEDAEDLAVQCSPVICQHCADPRTCLLG